MMPDQSPNVLFVVMPLAEVTDEQIEICPQTFETARYSIEPPERLILKYHTSPDADLLFEGVPKYTEADMAVILQSPEWSDPPEGSE